MKQKPLPKKPSCNSNPTKSLEEEVEGYDNSDLDSDFEEKQVVWSKDIVFKFF